MLSPRRVGPFALLLTLTLVPITAPAANSRAAEDTIVGADGNTYPVAPAVVEGRKGELYYGATFDAYCSGAGPELEQGMRKLAKLAKIVRKSGRRVIFTVVPDKPMVNDDNLDSSLLPHGKCDKRGMRQQKKLLDRFSDPSYLPLRGTLAKDKRQIFWKTDVHWNEVGASDYAKRLATELDPKLGRLQHYTADKSQTEVGGLNALRGDDTTETVPGRRPTVKVRVRPVKGTDSLYRSQPFDHAWRSKPVKRTYPGRTVLIGDSFTLIALKSVRPLFARGRFLWSANVPDKIIAKEIARSKTVVIEVVQFFTNVSPLGKSSFRKAVRLALK